MSATDDFNSSPAHVSTPISGLRRLAGAGIRPLIREATAGGRRSPAPGFMSPSFRSPAFASWASCSRHGIPPSSRSAYPATTRLGPDGVSTFHTCETRPDWVPSLLRDDGAHTTGQSSPVAARRFPAASPIPRFGIPSPRLFDDEAFEDSPTFTRPVFPSPVAPGWSGDPWASSSSFGPRRCQRRPLRWGQALEHWPGTTRSHDDPPLGSSLTTCDLVSHAPPEPGSRFRDQGERRGGDLVAARPRAARPPARQGGTRAATRSPPAPSVRGQQPKS